MAGRDVKLRSAAPRFQVADIAESMRWHEANLGFTSSVFEGFPAARARSTRSARHGAPGSNVLSTTPLTAGRGRTLRDTRRPLCAMSTFPSRKCWICGLRSAGLSKGDKTHVAHRTPDSDSIIASLISAADFRGIHSHSIVPGGLLVTS